MIARGIDFERGVLVRVPDWIGDAVASEPLLDALFAAARASGDPARLFLAGRMHVLALFEGRFEGARRIAHRSRGDEDHREWRGVGTALLLTGSLRSAWLARRAGIPRRVGFARDGRAWLLTDSIVPARESGARAIGGDPRRRSPWSTARFLPRPLARSIAELAAPLGLVVAREHSRLEPSGAALERARARIGPAQGPLALLNVGGRPESAKALAPERWGRIARELDAAGLLVVAACGPGEEAALDALAREAPDAVLVRDPVADLAELGALAALSAVVVTTDGGPRHVASAAGARVVTLFGPTDPRHTIPGPSESDEVLLAKSCGPCHRERCALPGAANRCLGEIAPHEVARRALALARSAPR